MSSKGINFPFVTLSETHFAGKGSLNEQEAWYVFFLFFFNTWVESKGESAVGFATLNHLLTTSLINHQRNEPKKVFKKLENFFHFISFEMFFFLPEISKTFSIRQVLPAVACERLSNLQSEALKHEVIGIDEGQFVS